MGEELGQAVLLGLNAADVGYACLCGIKWWCCWCRESRADEVTATYPGHTTTLMRESTLC